MIIIDQADTNAQKFQSSRKNMLVIFLSFSPFIFSCFPSLFYNPFLTV
jgi:hypothetical protein